MQSSRPEALGGNHRLWPRDRWHSAIRIQAVMRRVLAKEHVRRLRLHRSEALKALYHDADRIEATLRIQCWVRQCQARGRMRAQAAERERKRRGQEIVLSRPELFSIADLPRHLFYWDDLIRSERRYTHSGPLSTEVDADLFLRRRQLIEQAEKPLSFVYPHPHSTAFLDRATELFRAIDIRERGVVDERYLVEIHDMIGSPVPTGVERHGGVDEDPHRAVWCRALLHRILRHSGRASEFTPTTREGGIATSSSRLQGRIGEDPLFLGVAPGALNLNFDEFCTFLAVLAQE